MPRNIPSKLRDKNSKLKLAAGAAAPTPPALSRAGKGLNCAAALGLRGWATVKNKYRNTFMAASLLYVLCWYPEWAWDWNTDVLMASLILLGAIFESALKRRRSGAGTQALRGPRLGSRFKHVGPGKYYFLVSYLNYLVASLRYASNPASLVTGALATFLRGLLCLGFCVAGVAQLAASSWECLVSAKRVPAGGGGSPLLQSFVLPSDLLLFMEPGGGLALPWVFGLVGFVVSLALNSTFFNSSVRLLQRSALSVCSLFGGLVLLNSLKFSCAQYISLITPPGLNFILVGDLMYALACFGLSYYYYRRASKGPLSVLVRVAPPHLSIGGLSRVVRGTSLTTLFAAYLLFFFTLASVLVPLHWLAG